MLHSADARRRRARLQRRRDAYVARAHRFDRHGKILLYFLRICSFQMCAEEGHSMVGEHMKEEGRSRRETHLPEAQNAD